ncbi:MAG: hypothetical protein GY832_42620 [Chloroflexi bacterium]|nr:hypothetical protein [Chloroflexota bacterium]
MKKQQFSMLLVVGLAIALLSLVKVADALPANRTFILNSDGTTEIARNNQADWEPPIGIPRPEFGITETHYMYEGQTYDYDGTPRPYKDAGNGPYTHYIDNTQPHCYPEFRDVWRWDRDRQW